MKMIRALAGNFLNSGRGYVDLRNVEQTFLPRRVNAVYNLEPHEMNVQEVEKIFGEVLRRLSY